MERCVLFLNTVDTDPFVWDIWGRYWIMVVKLINWINWIHRQITNRSYYHMAIGLHFSLLFFSSWHHVRKSTLFGCAEKFCSKRGQKFLLENISMPKDHFENWHVNKYKEGANDKKLNGQKKKKKRR